MDHVEAVLACLHGVRLRFRIWVLPKAGFSSGGMPLKVALQWLGQVLDSAPSVDGKNTGAGSH